MTDGVTIEPIMLIFMIPDREKCLEILKELNIPENIIGHTKRVTRNAFFIGTRWPEKIDLKLLEASSLLHDICKLDEVKLIRNKNLIGTEITDNIKEIGHGYLGAKKVIELGFPELADIILHHTLQYLLNDPDFTKWKAEAIILTYADTIDVDKKVDSVENAFKRYYQRYPHFKEWLLKEEKIIYKLEKYIFQKIGLEFEDLLKLNE